MLMRVVEYLLITPTNARHSACMLVCFNFAHYLSGVIVRKSEDIVISAKTISESQPAGGE